jgi:hypothetical protein
MKAIKFSLANIAALIILVSVLPACGAMTMPVNYMPPVDGDVWIIKSGTTIEVINQAMASKPATFIYKMAGKDFFVIGRFLENGAGAMFTVIDMAKSKLFADRVELMPAGNHVSAKTMTDFLAWLKVQGYAPIAASQVPPFIVHAVQQGADWIVRTPFLFVVLVSPTSEFELYGVPKTTQQ